MAVIPSSRRWGALQWARWSMLGAWAFGATSMVWVSIQARWHVFHPHYAPLTILLVGMTLTTLVAVVCGLARTLRGPDRRRAAMIAFAAIPPIGFWCYAGAIAHSNWSKRWAPNTLAMRTAKVAGVTFMRLEADFAYRQRLESDRIVMYYDTYRSPYVERVDRPEEDLAEMDRHVARLEEVLGDKIRGKLFWLRGPALGSEHLSLHGLALGSAWSPEIPGGYRGDRHELAHAALDSFRLPASDPPYVLHEGWAMAQCGDSRLDLAKAARNAKAEYPDVSLRDLFGPEWYYRDSGPVYSIGGAFVDFLIRKFDGPRFRYFYTECAPHRIDSKCREVYQVDLDSLESAFWSDVDASLQSETNPESSFHAP